MLEIEIFLEIIFYYICFCLIAVLVFVVSITHYLSSGVYGVGKKAVA